MFVRVYPVLHIKQHPGTLFTYTIRENVLNNSTVLPLLCRNLIRDPERLMSRDSLTCPVFGYFSWDDSVSSVRYLFTKPSFMVLVFFSLRGVFFSLRTDPYTIVSSSPRTFLSLSSNPSVWTSVSLFQIQLSHGPEVSSFVISIELGWTRRVSVVSSYNEVYIGRNKNH